MMENGLLWKDTELTWRKASLGKVLRLKKQAMTLLEWFHQPFFRTFVRYELFLHESWSYLQKRRSPLEALVKLRGRLARLEERQPFDDL